MYKWSNVVWYETYNQKIKFHIHDKSTFADRWKSKNGQNCNSTILSSTTKLSKIFKFT